MVVIRFFDAVEKGYQPGLIDQTLKKTINISWVEAVEPISVNYAFLLHMRPIRSVLKTNYLF